MKTLSLFALLIGLGMSGCSQQDQSTPPAADTKTPAAKAPAAETKPATPAAPTPATNAPTPTPPAPAPK